MGFSRQEYWSGSPVPSPQQPLTWCNSICVFAFIACAFDIIFKKSLPMLMWRSSFCIFSSRSFTVPDVMFVFNLFWLDFFYGVRFHFLVCRYPVFPIPFIKETKMPFERSLASETYINSNCSVVGKICWCVWSEVMTHNYVYEIPRSHGYLLFH